MIEYKNDTNQFSYINGAISPHELDIAKTLSAEAFYAEVLDTSTPKDRATAAVTFGRAAELTGDETVKPRTWKQQALQAMDAGGAVVKIVARDPSGVTMFWQELSRQRKSKTTN